MSVQIHLSARLKNAPTDANRFRCRRIVVEDPTQICGPQSLQTLQRSGDDAERRTNSREIFNSSFGTRMAWLRTRRSDLQISLVAFRCCCLSFCGTLRLPLLPVAAWFCSISHIRKKPIVCLSGCGEYILCWFGQFRPSVPLGYGLFSESNAGAHNGRRNCPMRRRTPADAGRTGAGQMSGLPVTRALCPPSDTRFLGRIEKRSVLLNVTYCDIHEQQIHRHAGDGREPGMMGNAVRYADGKAQS